MIELTSFDEYEGTNHQFLKIDFAWCRFVCSGNL